MARGIPISAMVLMMPCALQAQERLVFGVELDVVGLEDG